MNPLATALCARVVGGGTGVLDWSDGRRRRVFYIERGAIALVQSNLMSESPERVAERNPALEGPALSQAVTQSRLLGTLREGGGEYIWREGISPPKREPADLPAALLEIGVGRPSISAYLKVVGAGGGWFQRQKMAPELASYLTELDGTRTVDEVVSFAPGEPQETETWLRLALAMGAIEDVGIESSTYDVRSVRRDRRYAGGVDDIAAMITEGLGGTAAPAAAPAPVDPAAVRFGPALERIRNATDHFATLGVTWRDPPETMRRAYFTLARELHPDRFTTDADAIRDIAAELFDRARAAWEVLGDDARREAYIKRQVHGEKTEDELAMEKVRLILDAEADFKRALAEFHAGRIPQAHETFLAVSKAVPEEQEFAAYAAFTTFKLSHTRDPDAAAAALTRLREVVAENERLDAALVLLGQAHVLRNQPGEARECFVKALRVRPSNPEALREMKRLEREKTAEKTVEGSLFNKLFGKR